MDEYDISKAFEVIERELMTSMIRNLDRHKAEETSMGIEWSQWQVEQLKRLEQYKIRNQKKYKSQFADINRQVDVLIRTARESGGMDQEIEILKAIKNGFKGYKRSGDAMTAQFFRTNDRKLEALIKATTDDMKKAETAILRMANDKYRQVIFNAQVYANTGAGTYQKAVDMATKDMLSAGLNCVEYSNGARHTLADYADMAIRTACKRAYLTGEGEKRKEWGISTVIMNKRGNPCPKCLPWVGKIMIDDVWSGGKPSDGKYPLMSTAVAAGLYHPRCKDSHTTYFEGVSTPPDSRFTQREIRGIEQENKEAAERQYAERQQGKYQRLAENSLDEENKRINQTRADEWYKKLTMELSSHINQENNLFVNWAEIQSAKYRKRLEKLSNNPKVVNAIETRTKWALRNRDGLKTEELYAISLSTGEEIARVTGQQIDYGVERTKKFTKEINTADRLKEKILLIHNHPRGLPPSLGDINALFQNENISGITVGHNGSIYYYTRPKQIIPEEDFKVALMRYSRYTENTGFEKALMDLSEEYGFVFSIL